MPDESQGRAVGRFTLGEMQDAIDVLERNNVPPWKCPACGQGYYLAAPPGWEPGDPLAVDCECGVSTEVAVQGDGAFPAEVAGGGPRQG